MKKNHNHNDTVCIEQLQLICRIGVLPWEKQVDQKMLLDIEYGCDASEIALTDNLSATVDYAELVAYTLQWVREHVIELIETLAERLAQALKAQFGLRWVKLKLKKIGSIPEAASVSVTVTR